jgi:hypothetical protein
MPSKKSAKGAAKRSAKAMEDTDDGEAKEMNDDGADKVCLI